MIANERVCRRDPAELTAREHAQLIAALHGSVRAVPAGRACSKSSGRASRARTSASMPAVASSSFSESVAVTQIQWLSRQGERGAVVVAGRAEGEKCEQKSSPCGAS